MSRKKTHEEFVEEVKIKQPNIEILSRYTTCRDLITCRCKIDGCMWTPVAGGLITSKMRGCPKCGREKVEKSRRSTLEDFKKKLSEKHPNIHLVDESKFVKASQRHDLYCDKCGHKWSQVGYALWISGCPKCARNAPKTPEEFRAEMAIKAPNLEILTDYVRANKKLLTRCKDCGTENWVNPNKLQQGQQCAYCKITRGERRIADFFKSNNIDFEPQKRFESLRGVGGGKLSYDFYVPSYNTLIEYQGLQHEQKVRFRGVSTEDLDERLRKQREHDKRKREYAINNGYNFIEIWYYDYDNIESILSGLK